MRELRGHYRRCQWLIAMSSFTAAVIGIVAISQTACSRPNLVGQYVDGRVIPSSGLKVNAYGLGELDRDAESDFRKLGKALRSYAKSKGKLPEDPRYLIDFTQSWDEQDRVVASDFFSKDYEKSDNYSEQDREFCYLWSYRGTRADGTKKPAIPELGERDVWIQTAIYTRSNQTVYRDGSYGKSPEGKFLVLWSDGQVEWLPMDSRVTVYRNGGREFFYQGEPNLPANALPSHEERTSKGKWWPTPGAFVPG